MHIWSLIPLARDGLDPKNGDCPGNPDPLRSAARRARRQTVTTSLIEALALYADPPNRSGL